MLVSADNGHGSAFRFSGLFEGGGNSPSPPPPGPGIMGFLLSHLFSGGCSFCVGLIGLELEEGDANRGTVYSLWSSSASAKADIES
jgi:hypothetical protein